MGVYLTAAVFLVLVICFRKPIFAVIRFLFSILLIKILLSAGMIIALLLSLRTLFG